MRPRRAGRWSSGSNAALYAGVATAVVALSPPVQRWGGDSLTAHMGQHVVLIGMVAPLLALGSPAPRAPRGFGLLAVGAMAQTVLVLAWHAPPLFDAAEDIAVVHAVEHACLLGGALLLWWAAARAGGPSGWGPGALATFLALVPMTALGVGMTFATTPWYAGHSDVADQQLGGVVMWAGGGLLALIGALGLGVAWVARSGDVGLHDDVAATAGSRAARAPG